MDLSHQFTVPVSVDETWLAFNDLERVAPCFPGATLTSWEGDAFAGTVKVKLGPISMQYSGTGTWKERDESAKRAVIEARGKDKRGNGTASATVTAQLTPDGSGTAVSVRTDLSVTGKPAQFGRGVMQDVSDKLLGQFVTCLTEQLSGLGDSAADDDGVATTAGSAEATGATTDSPGEPSGSPTDAKAPSGRPVPAATGSVADSGGGQPSGTAQAAPSPGHTSSRPSAAHTPEVQLDLMSTVLPVLARRYAAPAAGVLVALLVLRHLRRR